MVACSAAGIHPAEFRRLTLGEVWVVLEGEHRKRRAGLIDRIVAATRALAQAFGGNNALEGLDDAPPPVHISAAEARRLRFWRPTDGN